MNQAIGESEPATWWEPGVWGWAGLFWLFRTDVGDSEISLLHCPRSDQNIQNGFPYITLFCSGH